MVVKKEELEEGKQQNTVNAFEKFFFIALGSLSLLFLLITCWLLLTGEEVILLHRGDIAPRYCCISLSLQNFFPGRAAGIQLSDSTEIEQFSWPSQFVSSLS